MKGYEPTDMGVCPECGKVRYATRKRARDVARTVFPGDHHLSPYRCGDYWHIGNLPRAVVRGADRATLRPTKKRPPLQRGEKRRDPNQESA